MRIVFFGDSLTEGRDGASYLRLLAEWVARTPELRGVELINAGVGGDTVLNLARRVERDVAPYDPDWVVVFAGANDCTTALLRCGLPTPRVLLGRRYFRRTKGLRAAVTPEAFLAGMRVLVAALRGRTRARIAICTPAIYGESVTARPWRLLDRYAEAARQAATERDCELIDLHRRFAAELAATRPRRGPLRAALGVRARFMPRSAYEARARARGYRFTYDGIHFTDRGAWLVAEQMYDWLRATLV
jgi:lysophospholipase L1-like esterase